MSTAQKTSNKATVRRFHDATTTGHAELISQTIDELVEPDAVIHTPLPIEATGAQLLKEVFHRLHRAFPDLHITIEDLIEEGDKVVSRNTVTGTHQGGLHGHPANRQIRHVQRDLHPPLHGRTNSRDLGGRRRLLADETAWRDSRVANLTESAQGVPPLKVPRTFGQRRGQQTWPSSSSFDAPPYGGSPWPAHAF